MSKADDGNSTFGALFPAVTIWFGIQLACSLSLFLSFFIYFFFFSFFLSFSLSLCLSFLLHISFELCHVLGGLFSDNHLLHHRAMSATLKSTWKDINAKWLNMHANEKNERTWMHLEMKMQGKWKDINTNERNMKGIFKGKWRDMNTNWKDDECKWKENEGRCMQMNAIWKEHEVLPKHLKASKQLLDHRSISEPV